MQIEKLLEEQKKRFEKEFTYGVLLSASSDLSAGEDIRFRREYHPNIIFDWHKQSLKQFIDGLVEREDGEIREFKVTGDGEYHFGENQKVIGWNMAKEDTIKHLKEITKQLE